MVYLDSSALLKLLWPEPESGAVRRSVATEDVVIVSSLADLEAEAQVTSGWLAGRYGAAALRRLRAHLAAYRVTDPFRFSALSGSVFDTALEGQSESDELWTVGRSCLWPNCLFTGGHFEWRVPIDDHRTLSVGWFFDRVPNEMEPFAQERIPYWYGPIRDPQTGRWITTHVMNQDFVAWTGQGTIADRTQEHLGESDRGVIMMRRKLLEQAELVARGGEPMGLVRDPDANRCVALPIIGRDRFVDGVSRASFKEANSTPGAFLPEGFPFVAGQPEDVRKAYRRAMGLD